MNDDKVITGIVSFNVGTRVKHRAHGPGSVMAVCPCGRVVVKLDNRFYRHDPLTNVVLVLDADDISEVKP